MIQKLIEKLNKKRLKERISSAIVMVALIVSISGVVGAVSGIIVSNRYNYALKNYGFSQGDIGKMMITFADTRSYLRAAIGYQDENLVNSCAENYEKKKESCQQYTKEVKNTVSSADEEKIYNSITEKLNDYFDTCDAVLEKGKNTQDIDARHEAQQMAQGSDKGNDKIKNISELKITTEYLMQNYPKQSQALLNLIQNSETKLGFRDHE